MTAVVIASKHFRYFLEAREFAIFADHKPIVNALESEADRENARQARHLAYISQYNTDIQHLPGSSYIAADPLSRQQMLFFNAVYKLTGKV